MVFELNYGEDITDAIISICKRKKINSGVVFFIGAVQKATLGYYHQNTKKYKKIFLNKPLEIVSGMGNISFKNKKHFLHAHISLSDKNGKVFGGHLFSPTIIFVCEVFILRENKKLSRGFDKQTGLFLWQKLN
ncbi:MAG: DNA-binding protein [Elusimicrobia bacterium]|nr:DNA-binding protein [Elusimicrobiota bacterium]